MCINDDGDISRAKNMCTTSINHEQMPDVPKQNEFHKMWLYQWTKWNKQNEESNV